MTKAISSTTASVAAGAAGSILVQPLIGLVEQLLGSTLSWQHVTVIGIIALALVAGAAVINHARYKS